MDINTIRGLATLVALITFLSVVFWAYSSRRKNDFDEAAALPFADDPNAHCERKTDCAPFNHERQQSELFFTAKAADSNREMTENSQTRGVKQQ